MATFTEGMRSSLRGDWETPWDLFSALDEEFLFDLDVCALPETAKCDRFYTPEEDGLRQPWNGVCWCNPPYGRETGKWLARAYQASRKPGCTVVCLVHARSDTRWWHEWAMKANEIRYLRGRVKFLRDGTVVGTSTFPSVVLVYSAAGPDLPVVRSWDWK